MITEELVKLQKQVAQLREVLQAASDHLDYCGYGDAWERECAGDLEERISEALKDTK
jgi:hypothetical protein